MVPVVEPEVLIAGRHDLERCAEVTETVLRILFRHTHEQGLAVESLVLKPNMILAGTDCPIQPSLDEEADTSKRHGLGLIKRLVEQVDGTVDLVGTDGAVWTIGFPVHSAKLAEVEN